MDPQVEDLKRFLATAPSLWTSPNDPPIRQYTMANGETISCVFWRQKFFITGTDIVKILLFRFQAFGRPVLNVKKFEEGVFSDLRNLKPGTEAILEDPRSEFLDFLYKHGCIRTQKKQKVFFWFSVPHESLFWDAIERDIKRETNLMSLNNMMMSHRLTKQMAFMQAAAAVQQQQQGGAQQTPSNQSQSNAPIMMMPQPQIMPNNLAANRATAGQMSGANFNAQQFGLLGNVIDPFMINPSTMQMPKQPLMPMNSAAANQQLQQLTAPMQAPSSDQLNQFLMSNNNNNNNSTSITTNNHQNNLLSTDPLGALSVDSMNLDSYDLNGHQNLSDYFVDEQMGYIDPSLINLGDF